MPLNAVPRRSKNSALLNATDTSSVSAQFTNDGDMLRCFLAQLGIHVVFDLLLRGEVPHAIELKIHPPGGILFST